MYVYSIELINKAYQKKSLKTSRSPHILRPKDVEKGENYQKYAENVVRIEKYFRIQIRDN